MANANITEVRLLNVPLENDYLHTFWFDDLELQETYFKTKTEHWQSEFSYIRKDNVIRYNYHFDLLHDCNYVMYKNINYPEKWFYAFITKKEYVNEECTNIYIETDVIQTWLHDYRVKASFIEREHVKDDTIGLHTVPEGLETGDYVVNNRNANESLLEHCLIIGVTVDLNSDSLDNIAGNNYNGIFSGIKYYKVSSSEANKIIKTLADEGKSDAISCIFTAPKLYVESTLTGTYEEVSTGSKVDYGDWYQPGVSEEENYKPTKLNGYTPKNNKLLTYPYCYMLMSNNAGGSAIYKYELWNNPDDENTCPFRIYSCITPGFSIRIVPRYYNGTTNNNDEGLNLGKFPVCSWNTDVYTNWLTQNSINLGVSAVTSVAQIAGGIGMMATGAGAAVGVGMIASGSIGVASTIGQVYEHSLQPPQVEGNLNSGDVSYSAGYLTFTAHQMTIKKEFAQIIDEYFSMYGYKVCRVKEPNFNHRMNWWYTKTIDVNIDGAIPMEDMKKIKDCYNKGITFWRQPAFIGRYDVDNSIR